MNEDIKKRIIAAKTKYCSDMAYTSGHCPCPDFQTGAEFMLALILETLQSKEFDLHKNYGWQWADYLRNRFNGEP